MIRAGISLHLFSWLRLSQFVDNYFVSNFEVAFTQIFFFVHLCIDFNELTACRHFSFSMANLFGHKRLTWLSKRLPRLISLRESRMLRSNINARGLACVKIYILWKHRKTHKRQHKSTKVWTLLHDSQDMNTRKSGQRTRVCWIHESLNTAHKRLNEL